MLIFVNTIYMNDYFCVLPFFGYEFQTKGKGTHCCLLPKDYNIDSLRNDILSKQRSPFCSACWKLEDTGLISDRKLKNSALDFYLDKDINFIEQQVRDGQYQPIMIKNSTSNTCNSTCVTCNSGPSSAWAPLEKKLGLIPAASESMTREQIDGNLDYKNLVMLNLVGGEPLYEKLNFYILEKLLEHGNTNCFIAVTTNGSVALNDNQKSIFAQFKNLNFNLSIDGVGPVFEYMRYPLKWDKLLENLDFFKTVTKNISVSYTTSNLNVLYHHETIEWFNQNNLNYHFNPVINPGHFRPAALPKAVKDSLVSKHGLTKDLEFLLGTTHTDQDDTDFKKLLEIIHIQDSVKDISIHNYLPKFCQLASIP